MSMYSGHTIRAKRLSLGLSAEQLAKQLGVNKNNLYKWEKGHKPHDPEDFIKMKNWLAGVESVPRATRGQESAQNDELNQSTDKLTTSTKAPAFEMKGSNGNDKDATIRNQSDTVKTLADTSRSQQDTISKLTDLVTKLVKS